MAKGLVTNTYLTNIGNAIRTKLGVQTTYKPSQMAAAIKSIPTGGSAPLDLTTGVKFAYSTFATLPDEVANADWSVVTNMDSMFRGCDTLTTIPLLDTSNATSMEYLFNGCGRLTTIPLIDTSEVKYMDYMFDYCTRLTSVPLLNMSKNTHTQYMFFYCTSLTSVPQFDTSKVTSASSMFRYCTNLTTVPQFNMGAITGSGMNLMFTNCSSLSNESLNNILAMCISATLVTNTNYKTLKYIGLTSGQAATCESLSNWSAFIAAGWTSGY